MAVTEKHRHELFNEVERLLGPQHAETLMELLPPVGWADVATKHDLDGLRVATKVDLDGFRAATKADLDGFRAATKADLDGIRTVMATKDDLSLLRRDMFTWLLAAMGIQTAVIGILVGLG
jgi:hypothetical protein